MKRIISTTLLASITLLSGCDNGCGKTFLDWAFGTEECKEDDYPTYSNDPQQKTNDLSSALKTGDSTTEIATYQCNATKNTQQLAHETLVSHGIDVLKVECGELITPKTATTTDENPSFVCEDSHYYELIIATIPKESIQDISTVETLKFSIIEDDYFISVCE